MSENNSNNHVGKTHVDSILGRVIAATPQWALAFCGGMITLSVCIIAVLQLGGFTPPLQRIMNAKATEIERAADSLTASAATIEDIAAKIGSVENRVVVAEARLDTVEQRLDGVDRYHKGK